MPLTKVSSGTCSICGKALSDPVSLHRGIGPECYGKRKELERKDKTGNLFSSRATYSWGISGPVLWLIDTSPREGRSLTNDLENALTEIAAELHGREEKLTNYLIMYRDSEQIWDGITISWMGDDSALSTALAWLETGKQYHSSYLSIDFFSLQDETVQQSAKLKLMAMKPKHKASAQKGGVACP